MLGIHFLSQTRNNECKKDNPFGSIWEEERMLSLSPASFIGNLLRPPEEGCIHVIHPRNADLRVNRLNTSVPEDCDPIVMSSTAKRLLSRCQRSASNMQTSIFAL